MRKLNLVISCLAIGSMGMSAMAQGGKDAPPPPPRGERPGGGQPGGPGGGGMMRAPLSPEKAKAAQTLEATGVAKRIGLNEDQTKALIAAYTDARASHGAASEKLRKEMMDKMRDSGDEGGGRRGGGPEMMKAMQDLNKSEREKFEKALGDKLTGEQKSKALASLGAFNPQWDRWVDALAEFKLDAKKQQDGLNAIEDFVTGQAKVQAGGDREEMRAANQENRKKLSDTMKGILTEEQFAKFQESLGGGRGGQRGGGGGGGRGGEGGGDRGGDGGGR